MTSVLLLLPYNPFESAAGDARSMRTIAEMLAMHGFNVSALATTAGYRPAVASTGPTRADK